VAINIFCGPSIISAYLRGVALGPFVQHKYAELLFLYLAQYTLYAWYSMQLWLGPRWLLYVIVPSYTALFT